MIEFLYVRHGETLFNVTERAQGWCDSPLTERGVAQARACAERLAGERIDRAFTSPAGRARDTAGIVLASHGVTAVEEPGLREMYFGSLEGARIGEDPRMWNLWRQHDYTPVGGEDEAILVARIRDAFRRMARACEDGERVLVVSHRGYFLFLLGALFDWDLDELLSRPDAMELIPNASVARFSYDEGAWRLDALPE